MPLINWQILITTLLVAGVIFSALRYMRSRRLTLSSKIILTSLRTLWVIGLLLAFWEPTFRFERFEIGNLKIPVLMDVSASMQNFSPNTHVVPFWDTLRSLQTRTNGRVGFEYFLFGDSTRAVAANRSSTPLSFTDSRSIFPRALNESSGRFSAEMIIISDGHWTGARRSSDVFPRNTIYYLTLPEADPNPFVTVLHSAPETTPSDSSFAVTITASGYVRKNETLTISLKEKNSAVRTETVEIEPGYFSHTAQFKITNSRPGRRLYTAEAVIGTNGEVIPSVSSFVHQTIPHFLTYTMYSAKPTLDRRYITQALVSNNFFRARASSPDILFLFDWDSTAAGMVHNLPRHGAAVFLGCLPCSSSNIYAPSITLRPIDNAAFNINTNFDLRSIPPPQEVITCRRLPMSGTRDILRATNNAIGGQSEPGAAIATGGRLTDNVPVLFTGRFMGRHSLFCPIRGIWRWDFWPMATDRAESELFGFSNIILSAAKELLFDNIADQLIIYPAGPLAETDSARFRMSLPAAVPIFEHIKLSVQIKNAVVNIDTTMDYLPTGLNRQPLSFPALPPGSYGMSASITAPGAISAAFADSFTVNKDMSELWVLTQNTQYLQEFAQPLDMKNYPDVSRIFNSWDQRSAERHTITEIIRLHKSWLLLGIILAFLAAELVLRRVWGAD